MTVAGDAVCWGGNGNRYGENAPPPGGGPYIAISVSKFRTCALTDIGDIVCWGDIGYDQPAEVGQ